MPSFGLVIFGKFELGQYAEHSSGFPESELCLYGDFGLGLLAMPERNQAGSLRSGKEKILSLDHTAAPPVDSTGCSMRHCVVTH